MPPKAPVFFLIILLAAAAETRADALKPPSLFEESKNLKTKNYASNKIFKTSNLASEGTSLSLQNRWESFKISNISKSGKHLKEVSDTRDILSKKLPIELFQSNSLDSFIENERNDPIDSVGNFESKDKDKIKAINDVNKGPNNRIPKRLLQKILRSDKFQQFIENSQLNNTLKILLKPKRRGATNTLRHSHRSDDGRDKRLADARRAKAQYEFGRKTRRLLSKHKDKKKKNKKRVLLLFKNGAQGKAKQLSSFEGKSLGKIRLPLRDEPLYEYQNYGNFINKNGVQTPKTLQDPIFFIQLVDGESEEEENNVNTPINKDNAEENVDYYTDPDYLRLPLHKLHGPPYDHYRVRYFPKDPILAGPEEDPFYKNYVDPPEGFNNGLPGSFFSFSKLGSLNNISSSASPSTSPFKKRRSKVAKSLNSFKKEKIQRRSFSFSTQPPPTTIARKFFHRPITPKPSPQFKAPTTPKPIPQFKAPTTTKPFPQFKAPTTPKPFPQFKAPTTTKPIPQFKAPTTPKPISQFEMPSNPKSISHFKTQAISNKPISHFEDRKIKKQSSKFKATTPKPTATIPKQTMPTTPKFKRAKVTHTKGFSLYKKHYLETPSGYFTVPDKNPLILPQQVKNPQSLVARNYQSAPPTRNYKAQKLPKSISKRNNRRTVSTKVQKRKKKKSLNQLNKKKHPAYAKVPKTSFSCRGREAGMYADLEAQCQVWHICETDTREHAFLCPNGTIFNQKLLTCDWWYNVDCYEATKQLANQDILENLASSVKKIYIEKQIPSSPKLSSVLQHENSDSYTKLKLKPP